MSSVLLSLNVQGQQNLVLNGTFEEIYQCPHPGNTHFSEYVPFWQNGGVTDTPDLFHTCSSIPANSVPCSWKGCQEPLSGDSYVGLWVFSKQHTDVGREYIQTVLSEPLQAGIRYEVRFYVSLAEHYGGYAISTLGAALTAQPPETLANGWLLDAEPQVLHEGLPLTDTANWVIICDTVVSRGNNEQYLTIGNFHTDAESDTLLFNPFAQQWRLSYYFIDDVSVIALDSVPNSLAELEELNFSVHPNPAKDMLHVQVQRQMDRLQLFDLSGRAVLVEHLLSDRHSLNLSGIPSGIYLLEVSDWHGGRSVQKVVVQ